MSAPFPAAPAGPGESGPVRSVRTTVTLDRSVRLDVAASTAGSTALLSIGDPNTRLDLVLTDRDAVRRLHEATGQLLTMVDAHLRRQAAPPAQVPTPPAPPAPSLATQARDTWQRLQAARAPRLSSVPTSPTDLPWQVRP